MASAVSIVRRVAVCLALVSASASALSRDEPTLAAMAERVAGDATGVQREIEARLVDARARGDLRGELLAARDRLATSWADPFEGDRNLLLTRTLARAHDAGIVEVEAPLLVEEAVVLQDQGRIDEAETRLNRAVALAERRGDPDLLIDIYLSRGRFDIDNHRAEQALSWLERALALSSRAGETVRQAVCLEYIAESLRVSNHVGPEHLARSESHLKRAMALLDPVRHSQLISDLTEDLGMTYFRADRLDEAQAALERVLPERRKFVERWTATSYKLGRVELKQGRPAAARLHFLTAVEGGNFEIRARSLVLLARADAALGNQAAARRDLAQARPLLADLKVADFEAEYHAAMAEIAAGAGDYRLAWESARRQFDIEKAQLMGSASRRVEELSVRFDLKLKDADNQLLRSEQARGADRRTVLVLALVASTVVLVGILLFFVQQFRQRQRFQRLALRDELTGAPNRRSVLEQIKSERAHATALRQGFVLSILDIDFFKKVNDTWGHDAGDAVLTMFYDVCRATLRPEDMLGRWGGEEFVLVTRTTSLQGLNALFERLLTAVQSMDPPGLDGKHRISFSMGACEVPWDPAFTTDSVLACADKALYAAKEAGRACWRLERPEGAPVSLVAPAA